MRATPEFNTKYETNFSLRDQLSICLAQLLTVEGRATRREIKAIHSYKKALKHSITRFTRQLQLEVVANETATMTTQPETNVILLVTNARLQTDLEAYDAAHQDSVVKLIELFSTQDYDALSIEIERLTESHDLVPISQLGILVKIIRASQYSIEAEKSPYESEFLALYYRALDVYIQAYFAVLNRCYLMAWSASKVDPDISPLATPEVIDVLNLIDTLLVAVGLESDAEDMWEAYELQLEKFVTNTTLSRD